MSIVPPETPGGQDEASAEMLWPEKFPAEQRRDFAQSKERRRQWLRQATTIFRASKAFPPLTKQQHDCAKLKCRFGILPFSVYGASDDNDNDNDESETHVCVSGCCDLATATMPDASPPPPPPPPIGHEKARLLWSSVCDLHVCVQSGHAHHCGVFCDRKTLTGEGLYVCPLTGMQKCHGDVEYCSVFGPSSYLASTKITAPMAENVLGRPRYRTNPTKMSTDESVAFYEKSYETVKGQGQSFLTISKKNLNLRRLCRSPFATARSAHATASASAWEVARGNYVAWAQNFLKMAYVQILQMFDHDTLAKETAREEALEGRLRHISMQYMQRSISLGTTATVAIEKLSIATYQERLSHYSTRPTCMPVNVLVKVAEVYANRCYRLLGMLWKYTAIANGRTLAKFPCYDFVIAAMCLFSTGLAYRDPGEEEGGPAEDIELIKKDSFLEIFPIGSGDSERASVDTRGKRHKTRHLWNNDRLVKIITEAMFVAIRTRRASPQSLCLDYFQNSDIEPSLFFQHGNYT